MKIGRIGTGARAHMPLRAVSTNEELLLGCACVAICRMRFPPEADWSPVDTRRPEE
ncbi:hypothetical protein [Burkholderia ubonensis]|uniref:hypothetical protein n=1 Tax=Burkholderia ubonensis TaxID=101571 RepID=UPI0012FBE717|nr:hypothetical protein [Burkholderia ubonensis]